MPWEEPHVRDDLRQDLNLTVPERTKKKLDWLAHNTKRSKRVIVETALDIYLSAELRRLGMK
jgi:predicted transcriptional regulator